MNGIEQLVGSIMAQRSRRLHLAIVVRQHDSVAGFMWLTSTHIVGDDMEQTLTRSLADLTPSRDGVTIYYKWLRSLAEGFALRSLISLLEADQTDISKEIVAFSIQAAMVAANMEGDIFRELQPGVKS